MKRTILVPGIFATFVLTAFGQGQTPARFQNHAAASEAPNKTVPSAPATAAAGRSPYGVASVSGGGSGGSISVSSSSSSAISPLVLRFSGTDDETNPVLEEDLNIMTHLIERSLQSGIGEDAPEVKSGIPILFSDGRSVRGMYLDGFGALFMIKVRFPVFAPKLSESKEPQPASGSEWDKAKRELYSDAEGRTAELAMIGGASKYDAEQVEQLKKLLILTLKNAANIRNLKPNDFVGITVFGAPAAAVQPRKSRSRTVTSPVQTPLSTAPNEPAPSQNSFDPTTRADQKAATAVIARPSELRSSGQGTVMTIRVKKSDVEAFAKGALDLNAFQKRAEQHSYSGSGYGITSINSWTKSGISGTAGLAR